MKIRRESEPGIVQRSIGLQLRANRFYSPQDRKRWGMHPKNDEEQAEQDAAREELAALREHMTADDLWLAAKERRQIIGVGQNYAAYLNGYGSVSQQSARPHPPTAKKGDSNRKKAAKPCRDDPFAAIRESRARYERWKASLPPIAGLIERVRWQNAGTPECFEQALKVYGVYQDQNAPGYPPLEQALELAFQQCERYPQPVVMAAVTASEVYTHLLQPRSAWSERVFCWDERARSLLPGDLIEEGGGTGQYWLVMSDHLEKVCSLPEKEVFP